MPFDVESARKSGYSDDEILAHLTQTRKFDIDGALKAGYSKQDIIGHLATGMPTSTVPGTDDELIRRFGYDPEVIKRSPRYQANLREHGSGLSFLMTDPNRKDWSAKLADSPLGDLGMGALDVLAGTAQLVRHGLNKVGMISDEDTQYSDLALKVLNQDYQQNIRHGNASGAVRMVGNIVAPVPGTRLIRGTGLGANVGRAALTGATAAAMQPVDSAPGGYWAAKGVQTGMGAAVGPAVALGATAVGKGVAKAINAATGNIPKEAAEAMRAGKRWGIEPTIGDLTRNPIAQKTEVTLEDVPLVGTSQIRKIQHNRAQAAAGAIRNRLEGQFHATKLGSIDDVAAAAEQGDQYAGKLIEKIQNAGDDPDKILQVSIGLSNFRTRQNAEKLYDAVEELVTRKGLPELDPKKTAAVIESALTEAKASKIPNKDVIRLLETVKSNLGSGNTYGAFRQLRSDLGDAIESYHAGSNAIIGQKGVGYLQRIRSAVEGDLSEYVRQSKVPELQVLARKADDYYRTNRVPFKDAMLAQAAVDSEPDQIFNRFIKAGKGDRARKFYEGLDPKGRAAVRYEMVAKAINEATDLSKGVPGKGLFSPQKFYNELDRVSEAYGVFFKGHDKWEIDGFKNLMAHITRAGQYVENPPTGRRLVGMGLAAAGAGVTYLSPAAGMIGASTLALAKPLLMSDAGRKFLLAASSMKPGSPAMQKLLDQMNREFPAAAAKVATRDPFTASSSSASPTP